MNIRRKKGQLIKDLDDAGFKLISEFVNVNKRSTFKCKACGAIKETSASILSRSPTCKACGHSHHFINKPSKRIKFLGFSSNKSISDPYKALAEATITNAVNDLNQFKELGLVKDGMVINEELMKYQSFEQGVVRDTVQFFKDGSFEYYVRLLGYKISISAALSRLDFDIAEYKPVAV